jgi:hypothetical protein
VFNVVSDDGANRGFVSDATLRAQVDALNAAYATSFASDGSNLGSSADNPGITWKFDLQSITRLKAGDMCDNVNEKAIKAANRKGGKGALNLYITDLGSCGLLGYSTWPWELDPAAGKPDALTMDAVVIHHETLPGGSYKPYNMGRSAIHETGGWAGGTVAGAGGGRASGAARFAASAPTPPPTPWTAPRPRRPLDGPLPRLPERLQQGRRPGGRHALPERPHRGLPHVARLVPAAGGRPLLELHGGARGAWGAGGLGAGVWFWGGGVCAVRGMRSTWGPRPGPQVPADALSCDCPHPPSSLPDPPTEPPQKPLRPPQDYTDDKCMKGFTPLQHKRMETMRLLHRT